MSSEEFSSKCKELVDAFTSAVLEYAGDKYAAYMTDDMLLADISLCFTGNPSAGERVTLRSFVIRVGVGSSGDWLKIEGYSAKDGVLRAEDMPVTFDSVLGEDYDR